MPPACTRALALHPSMTVITASKGTAMPCTPSTRSPDPARHRWRPRARSIRDAQSARGRIGAIVLCAAAILFGSASPAFAHDQLVSSTPAESARLASAPTEISLEFSDRVLTVGAVVLLVDQDGTEWVNAAPELDGPRVSVPVEIALPDGNYEVRWRVVSSDGHPISSVIPFTVGDGVPTSNSGASSTSTAPAPVSPSESVIQAPEASAHAASRATDTGSVWRTVIIGFGGAAIALLGFALWSRRKRRPHSSSDASR